MSRSPVLGAEAPPTRWGLLAAIVVVALGTGVVYALDEVAPVVSLGVVFLRASC